MKIFEIAWLTIAGISLVMGIYQSFFTSGNTAYAYLFVITALAIAMYFIKRNSRHFIEKRKAQDQQDHQ